MISVTVEHTDSLGPEADVPALLAKLAAALGERAADHGPIRVAAIVRTSYVLAEDGWDQLSWTLKAPAGAIAALKAGPFEALCDLTEAHFAELYPRRSIALAFALEVMGGEAFVERLHPKPPTADRF